MPHKVGVTGYRGMLSIAINAVPLQEDPEHGLAPAGPVREAQLVGPVEMPVDAPLLHLKHEAGILDEGSRSTVSRMIFSCSSVDFSLQLHIALKCRLSPQ